MSSPDALRPGLAQPEMPDLALFDEPRHCADRILDRHCRIDPVLGIEIDDIDAKALQARIARLGNIAGAAVDAVGAARATGLAELGRDQDAVAPALQCPAEQLVARAPSRRFLAVEIIRAYLDRSVQP